MANLLTWALCRIKMVMDGIEKEKDFENMSILEIWFWCGLFGWVISGMSATFYKEKIVSTMWILLGPVILFIGLKSLVYGIIYAIKKKKSSRKYN